MFKGTGYPAIVKKDGAYTEYEAIEEDGSFDMLVYHKIKQIEEKEKRNLEKRIKNEKYLTRA